MDFLEKLGGGGTSACSTTGIMALTSAAFWRRSKCRRRNANSFEAFLEGLGYPYHREAHNASEMFLR